MCALVASTSLAQKEKAGNYRHSALFENEFLYLADGLALTRSVAYFGSETPEIAYTLGTASWLKAPVLPDQTGDTLQKPLIVRIHYLAWIPARKILVGKGDDPRARTEDISERYFCVLTDSRTLTFFKKEADLKKYLGTHGVKEYSLVNSELYFRKLVQDNPGEQKEPAKAETSAQEGPKE